MAYILQGEPAKLNGVLYMPGEVVPDDAVSGAMTHAGMVVTVSDAALAAMAAGQGKFDPSQHTVARVVEFARGHLDRIEEVRQAEEAGGNRSTLLEELDDLAAARDEAAANPPVVATHPVGVDESSDVLRSVSLDPAHHPDPVEVAVDPVDVQKEQGRAAAEAQQDMALDAPLTVEGHEAAVAADPNPKVGEPAREATRADLGDARTETMREHAGTDPAGEPNPSAPVPAFDPSKATIAEVIAYADAHTAPDELLELGRVEREGKGRKGLLDELARRLAEQTGSPPPAA